MSNISFKRGKREQKRKQLTEIIQQATDRQQLRKWA